MLEKQKTKDGFANTTDVVRVRQMLLDKGYYKEEELEAVEINLLNVTQDKPVSDYKVTKILPS